MKDKTPKLFTIGYEKRTITEYIDLLLTAKVSIIVDVRETAWSYKRDFCKNKFNNALLEAGIYYSHVREAGNPKKFRAELKSIDSILLKYEDYLFKTGSGLSELENIILGAEALDQAICLTCYERDHCFCHRSIIAKHLKHRFRALQIVNL